MAYQPYNPFSSERESNILRLLPFFLAFLLFALMGWAAYRGYESVLVKTKPAEKIVTDACSDAAGCNSGTVWLRCNAGMEVTDLANCPEYRHEGEYEGEGVDRLHSTVGIDLAHAWKLPRKHKRKAVGTDYYSGFVITDAGDIGSGKNTIGEWRCDKCPDPIPGHQMTEATKDTQIIWDESAPAPTLHRHEPDCKMPADVDVCPVQMLEPKASHD